VIVTKSFHFYAAHRNPEGGWKCASLHGHRYGLDVSVTREKVGSITIPFAEIEERVMKVIGPMDHSLLLYSEDPAKEALLTSGACGKVYEVPFQTSAENMAEHILNRLAWNGLDIVSVTLRETDTSSVTVSV
jgi:6-pyruvoyl-tetrahydropterin synthase